MDALDIQTLAGAIGALLVTGYLTWRGYKTEKEDTGSESVVGGVIQDNMSIRENTAQLIELNGNIEELNRSVHVMAEQARANQSALTRLSDIMILLRHEGR